MCWRCLCHGSAMSWPSSDNVAAMCWRCSGDALVMFWRGLNVFLMKCRLWYDDGSAMCQSGDVLVMRY